MNFSSTLLRMACTLLVLGAVVRPAATAEVRLRDRCACAANLVTLGDVADILPAADPAAERLAAVELFPAPASGQVRYLRLRELQDLLLNRGVSLAEHRFSGASQAVIEAAAPRAEAAAETFSSSQVQRARRRIETALTRALEKAGETSPMIFTFTLNDAQTRLVGQAVQEVAATGGRAPWVGPQQFTVAVIAEGQREEFALDVQLALPPQVVVAKTTLSRGSLIGPQDVELRFAVAGENLDECFTRVADVIEGEATRQVVPGSVLARSDVRARLLVRQGQVVSVYARSAGIRVRTIARARGDAAAGELVEVESIEDRSRFLAQVTGVQEVQVFAQPLQAK